MWTGSGTNGQSALSPASDQAQAIAEMSWVMFAGAGVVFLIVMAVLSAAVIGPGTLRRLLGGRRIILVGGVVFPVVVLSALLIWGFLIAGGLRSEAATPEIAVDISGEQWWWRVTYRDAGGTIMFATANEIHLAAGSEAALTLTSPDVIHSFWVPNLAGKIDMIPGRTNRLRITPQRPGVYRGQCAEFCGGSHALMALVAVVHDRESYARWISNQMNAAREPVTTEQKLGREVFTRNGCGACHTVRGTGSDGKIGPDLTHIGSRLSLAAGSFPNNLGTLAGWVSSAQHLKPGNRMPSFSRLTGTELRAVAAYLASLE